MIFNSNKHYSPLSDRHPDAPARSAILLVSSPFDPSAHAATSASPTHLEGLTALTAAMSLVKLARTNAVHLDTRTAYQSSVQSLTRVFALHHGSEEHGRSAPPTRPTPYAMSMHVSPNGHRCTIHPRLLIQNHFSLACRPTHGRSHINFRSLRRIPSGR